MTTSLRGNGSDALKSSEEEGRQKDKFISIWGGAQGEGIERKRRIIDPSKCHVGWNTMN